MEGSAYFPCSFLDNTIVDLNCWTCIGGVNLNMLLLEIVEHFFRYCHAADVTLADNQDLRLSLQ